MNLKKYDLGDEVNVNGATYIVDSVYDDGVAEVLICACDRNRSGNRCTNCSDERQALGLDDEGMMDYEWMGAGFIDKATIINEPEIKVKHVSKLVKLEVRMV